MNLRFKASGDQKQQAACILWYSNKNEEKNSTSFKYSSEKKKRKRKYEDHIV